NFRRLDRHGISDRRNGAHGTKATSKTIWCLAATAASKCKNDCVPLRGLESRNGTDNTYHAQVNATKRAVQSVRQTGGMREDAGACSRSMASQEAGEINLVIHWRKPLDTATGHILAQWISDSLPPAGQ